MLKTVIVRVFVQCALLRDCEQELRVYASLLKFVLHLLKGMNFFGIPYTDFDVLLTAHLSIILSVNQLNAQNRPL